MISEFKALCKVIHSVKNLGSRLALIFFVFLSVGLLLSTFVHITLLDSGYPIYIFFGINFALLIYSFIMYNKPDSNFKEDIDKGLEATFLKIMLLFEEGSKKLGKKLQDSWLHKK